MEEYTIDLLDLFRRIVLKWKWLVIGGLCGALLLNGLGVIRSARKAASEKLTPAEQVQFEIKEAQERVSSTGEALSEQELTAVYAAVDSYKYLCENFNSLKEYVETSAQMKFDAGHVLKRVLSFRVESDHAEAIANFYRQKLSDAVEHGLRELVSVDICAENLMASGSGETSDFDVTIIADCDETVDLLATQAKQTVQDNHSAIMELYGEHTVALLADTNSQVVGGAVLDYQNKVIENLDSMKSRLGSVASFMNSNQKALFAAILELQSLQERAGEQAASGETESQVSGSSARTMQILKIKYLLVGLVLGICVPCGVIAVPYVLGGKVHTVGDLAAVGKLFVFGTICDEQKRKSAGEKKINALFGKTEDMDINQRVQHVVTGITLAAEKESIQSVFVTGSCELPLISRLMTELGSKGIQCSCGGFVADDTTSLKSMADADGIVIVEAMDKSSLLDIQREIDICKKMQIPVLGCVIVES